MLFQQGQRIVVTSSTAKNERIHPAIGDMGYLSNAYLFYRNRFVLLDIFFFKYATDEKGKLRNERKKFIVDLGMSGRLKYNLLTKGLSRKFFIDGKYVTNLTEYSHVANNNSILPHISCLWSRCYNRKDKTLIDEKSKIPCGQIAKAEDCRKLIVGSLGIKELQAWFSAVQPILKSPIVINSSTGRLGEKAKGLSLDLRSSAIQSQISNNRQANFYVLSPKLLRTYNSEPHVYISSLADKLVKHIRYIQSLAAISCNRIEIHNIRKYFPGELKSEISQMWRRHGYFNLVDEILEDTYAGQFVMSVLLRGLATPSNFPENLQMIQDILPWADEEWNAVLSIFSNIRKEITNDSAALARIYEGGLMYF